MSPLHSGPFLFYRGRGWFRSVDVAIEPRLDIVARDNLFADDFEGDDRSRNVDVFSNGNLAVVERAESRESRIVSAHWRLHRQR